MHAQSPAVQQCITTSFETLRYRSPSALMTVCTAHPAAPTRCRYQQCDFLAAKVTLKTYVSRIRNLTNPTDKSAIHPPQPHKASLSSKVNGNPLSPHGPTAMKLTEPFENLFEQRLPNAESTNTLAIFPCSLQQPMHAYMQATTSTSTSIPHIAHRTRIPVSIPRGNETRRTRRRRTRTKMGHGGRRYTRQAGGGGGGGEEFCGANPKI